MEMSVNLHAEVSVPFSIFWFTLPVFGINEIPLLVDLAVSVSHKDLSILGVVSALNISNLILFLEVLEEWSLPSEELEPS